MNMMEKVARALAKEAANRIYHPPSDDVINNYSNRNWPSYMDAAKYAIEAMLEPTEEMLLAVHRELGDIPRLSIAYQIMIQEALKQ